MTTDLATIGPQTLTLEDFFALILPSTDTYFAFVMQGAARINIACGSVGELADVVREKDALGFHVYHACASYLQPSYTNEKGELKQRTKENAGHVRSYWLDIDCGADKAAQGKGYANEGDAEAAVKRFCTTVGVPIPLMIRSGGGLHCYWPFSEDVPKVDYLRVAAIMRQLVTYPGTELLADPTRNGDISSVLRPVGTTNRKPQYFSPIVTATNSCMPLDFGVFESALTRASATGGVYAGRAPKTRISRVPLAIAPNAPPIEAQGEVDRVVDALGHIDPDCDYPVWFQMLAAVHWTGWFCAETVARNWSAGGDPANPTASKYDPMVFDTTWSSLQPDGGVTLGTLFHIAQVNGYRLSPSVIGPFDLSQGDHDVLRSQKFAQLYRDRFIRIYETGDVLEFSATSGWNICQPTRELILAQEALEAIKADARAAFSLGDPKEGARLLKVATEGSTLARMKAMAELGFAQSEMSASIAEFNVDPHLVGVGNGVLDLGRQTLLAPDPSLLISKRLAVHFDATAAYPIFQQFLDTVQPDKDVQRLLQQLAGLFLFGKPEIQKLIFLYGAGANGKSTFIELMKWMAGDYAQKVPTDLIMQGPRTGDAATPNLAILSGMRLAYCNELPENGKMNSALVKDLTGGDTIVARHLYGNPLNFLPQFNFVMVGNHKPEIRDMSDGMWRRMLLIPFTHVVPEAQRDPNLAAKLQKEGAGLLNWALGGLKDYRLNGLVIPQGISDAVLEYKTAEDIIGDWFSQHMLHAAGSLIDKGKVYGSYSAYCTTTGNYPVSHSKFTKRLSERSIQLDAGRRHYKNIDFQPMHSKSMQGVP
jgi:P4 family phage/plasmid primase-like protien